MITQADLVDCLALAVAAFPQYPLNQAQVRAYYELLKDLDISKEDLFLAIKKECQESTFFPTAAGIRSQLRSTPVPPPYTALEAPVGIEMPQYVSELKERLKQASERLRMPD